MKTLPPEETNEQLKVLTEVVDQLSPETISVLKGPIAKLNNVLNRKLRILELIQDALSQLRLDMKYLMFDLEATRRERDEWKAKAEGK